MTSEQNGATSLMARLDSKVFRINSLSHGLEKTTLAASGKTGYHTLKIDMAINYSKLMKQSTPTAAGQ
jgi:hypothetical protein